MAQAPFILAQKPGRKWRIALVGSGWWGKNILKEAMASGQCKVVALCDADSTALEVAADQVTDLSGDKPKTYADYRELLEKEKPEIVIIAPTGHTINESRAMLKASRDSGRVVQVGLHRRVGPHHVNAMKFLKSGAVGDVGMVRLFAHGGGGFEKPQRNSEAPEGMNWDLWCGPAPKRPFNGKLHPGGWRNFLDYANGTLGDWGVHWLDQVLMWTEEKYPKRIYSTGGRQIAGAPVLNETEQTTDAPDHQVVVYDFEKFTCIWEHRRFAENNAEKHRIGAYFYGTKGTLHIGWQDGWTFYPTRDSDPHIHEESQLQQPDGHNLKILWADFLASIEDNKSPAAGIELAHRSSVLPLLGMISLKVGRSINWDGASEQIVGDAAANALLSRPYRAPYQYPTI